MNVIALMSHMYIYTNILLKTEAAALFHSSTSVENIARGLRASDFF